MRIWLFVPLLLACNGMDKDDAEVSSTSWLQGFGVGWNTFNHRISVLRMTPTDPGMDVAFVGGASTTGIIFDEAGTCVTSGCQEFPFADPGNMTVTEAFAESTTVRFGSASVSLDAGATAETTQVTVELGEGAEGDAVVFLRGLHIDTAAIPAPGNTCYDTRHGWLPRRISLAAEVVSVDAGVATVEVSAVFEAGETREEERACMDAVYEDAKARVGVDVAVAVGEGSIQTQTIRQQDSWDCPTCPNAVAPPPQEPPAAVALTHEAALMGWSSLDLRLHQEDDFPRGAYLRTITVDLDAEGATAAGHATNFSPVSQQSGFDFVFEGVVTSADFDDVDVSLRRYSIEAMPTEVDATTGEPTVTSLSAE